MLNFERIVHSKKLQFCRHYSPSWLSLLLQSTTEDILKNLSTIFLSIQWAMTVFVLDPLIEQKHWGIFLNNLFFIPHTKEMHRGLEWHEVEEIVIVSFLSELSIQDCKFLIFTFNFCSFATLVNWMHNVPYWL